MTDSATRSICRFHTNSGDQALLDQAFCGLARRSRLVPTAVAPEPRHPSRSARSPRRRAVAVAGLGELPTHRGALAAVPDSGARLFGTSPLLPGATRLAVVPFRLQRDDHKARQLEIKTPRGPCDHRNWDLAAKYGRYVPASMILDVCVAVEGRKRDHRRLRGTRQERSRPLTGVPPSRGRPPEQPQGSVLIPTRPSPHVRERRERG